MHVTLDHSEIQHIDDSPTDGNLWELVTLRMKLEQVLRTDTISLPPTWLAGVFGRPHFWRERALKPAERVRFRQALRDVNEAIDRASRARWQTEQSEL
jgi:hypothetical protein